MILISCNDIWIGFVNSHRSCIDTKKCSTTEIEMFQICRKRYSVLLTPDAFQHVFDGNTAFIIKSNQAQIGKVDF